MKIQSIKLEHTNPSLGPHETRTTVTLSVTKDNSQNINQFINNAKINNTISLYKYLKAIKTKSTEILDHVLSNSPADRLEEGSSISNLLFYFEDGQIVELSDVYRKFEITLFKPEFTSYMVEKGTVNRYGSNVTLKTKPPRNSESDESNETKRTSE